MPLFLARLRPQREARWQPRGRPALPSCWSSGETILFPQYLCCELWAFLSGWESSPVCWVWVFFFLSWKGVGFYQMLFSATTEVILRVLLFYRSVSCELTPGCQPARHCWYASRLVMAGDVFHVWLDLVCWYLMEDFCCTLTGDTGLSFSCDIFVSFYHQGNPGLRMTFEVFPVLWLFWGKAFIKNCHWFFFFLTVW